MRKNIMVELVELITARAPELKLPKVIEVDNLRETGDCLSFQPDSVPSLEMTYIGGSKVYAYSFTVLAGTQQGRNSTQNLKAINWLDAIGTLFEEMVNYQLSQSRIIRKADVLTPAIVTRTEGGRLVYSLGISLTYEEDNNA